MEGTTPRSEIRGPMRHTAPVGVKECFRRHRTHAGSDNDGVRLRRIRPSRVRWCVLAIDKPLVATLQPLQCELRAARAGDRGGAAHSLIRPHPPLPERHLGIDDPWQLRVLPQPLEAATSDVVHHAVDAHIATPGGVGEDWRLHEELLHGGEDVELHRDLNDLVEAATGWEEGDRVARAL